ncbi:MAG: hypothetical protein AAF721_00465 [Myxococcota bacterium]
MADTEYKAVDLSELDPFSPVLGPLAPNTLMRWAPTLDVMQAQDTAVAGSRRIVAWVGMNGLTQIRQPNSTTEPVDEVRVSPAIPTYPNIDQWRTKGEFRVRVTPGCMLHARCIYMPSGMTHRDTGAGNVWEPAGGFGQIRVRVTWNGDIVAGPNQFTALLEPSPLQYAQAAGEFAAHWNDLREVEIPNIRPPGFDTGAETSEHHADTEAEVLLQVRGGVRDVVWIVWEVPRAYVFDNDDAGPHAVHAASAVEVQQSPVPQTSPADGASYEENRFGTYALIDTASHQDSRLGPRIAEWSSWTEDANDQPIADNNPTDPMVQEPVSTSSTTFVGVADPDITEWSVDSPGFAVAGAHALRHHLNDSGLVVVGGVRALVPVRVWCRGRWTDTAGSAMGIVRFQTSEYEWIELEFTDDGNAEEVERFGYMASQVAPDDDNGLLIPLMRVDAGTGLLEVFEWSVDWYDAR